MSGYQHILMLGQDPLSSLCNALGGSLASLCSVQGTPLRSVVFTLKYKGFKILFAVMP